jgi:hypothetical protein
MFELYKEFYTHFTFQETLCLFFFLKKKGTPFKSKCIFVSDKRFNLLDSCTLYNSFFFPLQICPRSLHDSDVFPRSLDFRLLRKPYFFGDLFV